MRSLEGLRDSHNIQYVYLDLQEESSIQEAVDRVYQIAGNLDAVIHNAGIAYLDSADVMSDQEARHVFDVNFFGPLSLTKAILPKFRKKVVESLFLLVAS